MFLSTSLIKQRPDSFIDNVHNHLIMQIDQYQYDRELITLKASIEIMNTCNSLKIVNDFYRDNNIHKRIDFSILIEVTDALFNNKMFTDEKAQEFFFFINLLDNFIESASSFSPSTTERMGLSYEIELFILGYDLLEQETPEFRTRKNEIFSDGSYSQSKRRLIAKEISMIEFKKEIKKLLGP